MSIGTDEVLSFDEDGFWLDLTAAHLPRERSAALSAQIAQAFTAMRALEAGAIANPDEGRRVGHYWLRAPELAPEPALRDAIERTRDAVFDFARAVHEGAIAPPAGGRFDKLLLVGIGGSALGPQLVAHALSRGPSDPIEPFFFDNTDPHGFERTLARIGDGLARTLTVVVSKSGGTQETRNGMLAARRAYEARGLAFASHAVAVTQEGSGLDRVAVDERWIARFPMWDWVGGRTSELSAVGLLPAALQGLDGRAMLEGARRMDALTRVADADRNPAMRLALAWLHLTEGRGAKDMVVLPYRDRVELLSRYLQQLVMESLGKRLDLDGRESPQGLAVYGNKGSTDQHAYVQQLRDGIDNFFVTFIEALDDEEASPLVVEGQDITAGDYLFGFLEGTRRALSERGRRSLTITVRRCDARSIGMLLALFERAVGLYASLVHVNAYHQPGVEAGKKAAGEVVALQGRVMAALRAAAAPCTAQTLAEGLSADEGTVWRILRRLAANTGRGVTHVDGAGSDARYRAT
jgi:glucose-6-phosphate isomerase